jgi:hypothetical protein
MKTIFRIGCTFATLTLAAAPAFALNGRSAVAITGVDSNPCTVVSPCRNMAAAMLATAPGGEVLVLDSGGYGPFTITQAIQIIASPGVLAFISAASGDAITVNAHPTDNINLRGFYLDGAGTGGNGITVNSANSVSCGGCTITGFAGNGINFIPSAGSTAHLVVNESTIHTNSGSGILIKPAVTGNSNSEISNTSLSGNVLTADGSVSSGNVGVLVDGSHLRYCNGGAALVVSSNAFVLIDKSHLFACTGPALNAIGTGRINFGYSSASNMGTLAAGVVNSYGNNEIAVTSVGSLTHVSLN